MLALASGQSFNKGDLILREPSFVYTLHVEASSKYCSECLAFSSCLQRCSQCKHVFYCSQQCQKSNWIEHKLECVCIAKTNIFPAATIRLLFRIISSGRKDDPLFNHLVSHLDENIADSEMVFKMNQAYAMLALFSNKRCMTSRPEFYKLFCQIKINAFNFSGPDGCIAGVALFKRSSKLDHSCQPNAEFAFVGKTIKIIACKDIADYSQIRISYIDLLMPTKRRQQELKSNYFFECHCKRCASTDSQFGGRIPKCHSPLKELCLLTEAEQSSESLATCSSDIFSIFPSFAPDIFLHPEKVYVCTVCHRTYNAAVFDAFEKRVYEVDTFIDAMNLFKTCQTLNVNGDENAYLRLYFNDRQNLLFLQICRTIVNTYNFTESDIEGDDLNLVIDAGLRLIEWLTKETKMQHQFSANLACSFLFILANAIFSLQERLANGRESQFVSLTRLQRFSNFFFQIAVAVVPSIRLYAPHLPSLSEQLNQLCEFAQNLNFKL